jgi:hypothetical protein
MPISLKFALGTISLCLLTASSVNLPVFADAIPDFFLVQNTDNASEQLTKENIQNVLNMMETARKQADVEGVLKHIAPFAHSTVTTEIDDDLIVLTLDGTAEHRDFLTEIYQTIDNRSILNKQMDIRLSPDGQMAIVVIQEEREYMTEDGENFLSESVDTLRFGLVNGQPMVVSATLKGWLAPIPSSNGN